MGAGVVAEGVFAGGALDELEGGVDDGDDVLAFKEVEGAGLGEAGVSVSYGGCGARLGRWWEGRLTSSSDTEEGGGVDGGPISSGEGAPLK